MNLDNVIAKRNGKTIYIDGDKVIKCFDENYSKENILNEALNHTRVEGRGLTVPNLISVSQVDGKWSITTEFIDGKTLEKLMEEKPDKTEEYIDKFIDIQLEITSKEVPLLNKLKEKLKRKFKNANLSSATLYNLSARLESFAKEAKVCHGDFNPSNIIIRNDGIAYTLDWSHVTVGNPCFDFATSYILFLLDGRSDLAELYMEKITKRLDIQKCQIQNWFSIAAVAQLDRANDEEKKILDTFLEVVDD